ncbi:bromodomain-containing protein 8-like isoform X1 [Watersipora subatra]|uniref:bromodomain-containing protein 8-like isoform X1 n=1 Tax=Watersipora subatra TaxID=2589382 RepID=UPI00355C7B68
MAAHPKLLHQKPLDVWTLRERLLLSSAVLQSGDRNWVSVSRAIKNQSTESRSAEFFSQKNCALQYGHLLESAETPKRKRSDKNEVIPVETQGHQIVTKLKHEYMEHLVQEIKRQQEDYLKLDDEIEMVSSGYCDEKLSEIWEQIQRKKNVKQETETSVSVSQSETSVENEQTFSSLTTNAPDVEDTSTQDSQEADIEVDDQTEDTPSFSDAINSTLSSQDTTGAITEPVDTKPIPTDDTTVEQIAATEETTVKTEELEPSTGDAADDVAVEDTRIESTSEVIEETVTTGGFHENITAQSADEGVLDKSHESAAELSPAKSIAKPVEKVEEPVPEVVQQSELRAPVKSRQSCKTRLSETSIQEDVNVDDVMPRPAKLTISVVPTEIERSMSPASTVSSTSDAKQKEALTPTNISGGSRRRSSRVTKIKDEKKDDATSAGAIRTTSETEPTSDEEETTINTSKALDVSPLSSPVSQQSEPEEEKSRKAWKKSLMNVWKTISQHKFSNVFMHQVTDEIAPGYSSCVHRPMSLSTIKQNLEKNAIKTTEEFVRDVMLMFVNAMMYNNHEYDVYAMAQEMYDEAITAIEQHTQYSVRDCDMKLSTSRGRRSEVTVAAAVDKEHKAVRRSSADQHSESHSAAKKRKTRADD